MRNMRQFSMLTLACLLAGPVDAQTVPDGCFMREYTQDHLDRNPNQVVRRISILFAPHDQLVSAEIEVLMADQGHAARDGFGDMRMSEWAANFNGPMKFGIECDGGGFEVIAQDADGLTIETGYVRVALDGCSGDNTSTTLAEVEGELTRYRLERREVAACAW